MIPLLLIAAAAAALAQPEVALLPCAVLPGASAEEAAWLDEQIGRELGARVPLVPREEVRRAMAARGVTGLGGCDDACLAQLGEAIGADRVVSQTLYMQRKVQSEGIVWVWVLHQVDVATRAPYGHFERADVCPRTTWKRYAGELAERLAAFDPTARLEPRGLPKAEPQQGPKDVPRMVFVPAGEFVMGSEWGEPDEVPRHIVELDAFYIDTYEVTNAEYQRCIDEAGCTRQITWDRKDLMGPTQPVVGVRWYDAVAYCGFAGKRLPTEAEWEKAARGTDERRYPWGDEWHPEWVNMHTAKDGFAGTAPVGSFPMNVSPYGAYDMAGNAWEWTQDLHDSGFYARSPRKNPVNNEVGWRRVMRGGSWMYDVPFFVTAFNRSPGRAYFRKEYVGFRCAMDAPPDAP
jgi:sulfatase modifying factor 1